MRNILLVTGGTAITTVDVTGFVAPVIRPDVIRLTDRPGAKYDRARELIPESIPVETGKMDLAAPPETWQWGDLSEVKWVLSTAAGGFHGITEEQALRLNCLSKISLAKALFSQSKHEFVTFVDINSLPGHNPALPDFHERYKMVRRTKYAGEKGLRVFERTLPQNHRINLVVATLIVGTLVDRAVSRLEAPAEGDNSVDYLSEHRVTTQEVAQMFLNALLSEESGKTFFCPQEAAEWAAPELMAISDGPKARRS